jgi:hypothetical protein
MEKVDLELFNKKGERVSFPAAMPKEYATRYIEFNGVRYERDKKHPQRYTEVGKAQGVKQNNV